MGNALPGGRLGLCVCVHGRFPAISDTGLEVSVEEGPLGLCGLIQPGFVLLTVAPFPIIGTTHLDQAENVLEALLEVVR